MLIYNKIKELHQYIAEQKQKGLSIGFVPTMGALHQGHMSLIEASQKSTGITICSIFVNPNQFNKLNDLKLYPRTPESDINLLKASGCSVLYMPEISDVYQNKEVPHFNFGYLDDILEGKNRPYHFNGVGQVLSILFQEIMPDKAFFGSKDYQQVLVVRHLIKQLNFPIQIISCPILRETDGLAMSSRNTRLTKEERNIASLIPQMMLKAKQIAIDKGVEQAYLYINQNISNVPEMKLDYYSICSAETLQPISSINKNVSCISVIAVFVGEIRLIDNLLIKN